MRGWDTGLSGRNAPTSTNPRTPKILGTLNGPAVQRVIAGARSKAEMWNKRIAAGEDPDTFPNSVIDKLRDNRIAASAMIDEAQLNAAYVTDNKIDVEAPPGFERGIRRQQCYRIALELAASKGFGIVVGAVQEAGNRYSEPAVHVWNVDDNGTMYDGQLGSGPYEWTPLDILTSVPNTEAELASIAWNIATGLTNVLLKKVAVDLQNEHRLRVLVQSVLREYVTK